MGRFLDMLKNDMEDPETGQRPNENYAREVLQLFSIGLHELNLDGTPRLDQSGAPIPTYGQAQVDGFARVFTGWTFYQTTKPYRVLQRARRTGATRWWRSREAPLARARRCCWTAWCCRRSRRPRRTWRTRSTTSSRTRTSARSSRGS